MIQALLAVLTASLFGSVHCVGMCGPFVLIASKATTSDTYQHPSSFAKWLPLSSYHFGRLTTYLILGLLVGTIASAGRGLAGQWGIGSATSILMGITLMALGIIRIWKLALQHSVMVGHSKMFVRWSEIIAGIRRKLRTQSHASNAFVWGLLSTWLPCGWLYLFALASATAGSVYLSLSMMAAFWLGTLPALSVVAWGGQWFSKISPNKLQWFSAFLLIGFGFWTLTSRSSIDLSSLVPQNPSNLSGEGNQVHSILDSVEAIQDTPLPCCSEETGAVDAQKVK
ncbi:MAG: sulfite exporter TauE/SafE family protein [Pirellula sp.]